MQKSRRWGVHWEYIAHFGHNWYKYIIENIVNHFCGFCGMIGMEAHQMNINLDQIRKGEFTRTIHFLTQQAIQKSKSLMEGEEILFVMANRKGSCLWSGQIGCESPLEIMSAIIPLLMIRNGQIYDFLGHPVINQELDIDSALRGGFERLRAIRWFDNPRMIDI